MNERTSLHRVKLFCGHEDDVRPDVDPTKAICEDCRSQGRRVIPISPAFSAQMEKAFAAKQEREEAVVAGISFEQYQIVWRRVRKFYARALAMLVQAATEIDLQRRAEGSDLPVSEYMMKGQALIDYSHAQLDAMRLVLPEFIRECRAIGLSGRNLAKAVDDEIQDTCGEFGIPEDFRGVLFFECKQYLIEAADGSDALALFPPFPLKPQWKPELHAIVHQYRLECQKAGAEVPTISAIWGKARVNKTDFYKWIKGKKPDTAIDRRIRSICQIKQPHLRIPH